MEQITWSLTSNSYSGMWYSDYLPISTSKRYVYCALRFIQYPLIKHSYDNTGHKYNITRITTSDFRLDLQKYKEYSPLFLSTTFALQYGLSFASIIAVLFHVGLFHGKEIWMRFRMSRSEPKDIHGKLYEKYPEVPLWWFAAMLLVMIGLGIVTVLKYDLQLPIWAYFFSLVMAAFFIIPIGMIYAITVSHTDSQGGCLANRNFRTFKLVSMSSLNWLSLTCFLVDQWQ
jgi:OPT oligopeptide transporter protein